MNAPKRSNLICELDFGLRAIISVAATSVIGQLATYPNLAPQARQTSVQYTRLGVRPGLEMLYLMMAFVRWPFCGCRRHLPSVDGV